MGNCRFPLYITPDVACEWLDTWEMLNRRRIDRQRWSFSATPVDITDVHPTLKISWAVAEQTLDRARHQYRRACVMMTDPEMDTWDDGKLLPELSDGESIPMEPVDTQLPLPPHLALALALGNQDPCLGLPMDPNTPVVSAPKRPGAPLDISAKKRATHISGS